MMLLEAASLGSPIVSSDIVENKAVLPRQALFFKSGDAKDLLEKIEWALNHPEQMEILGARAKAWVMENYQWDSITNQYEKLYRSVLEGIGDNNRPCRIP